MKTATITTKGQVLIPKPIRDKLGLKPRSSVVVECDEARQQAVIRPGADIVDLAGTIAKPKGKTVAAARQAYEKDHQPH